MHFVCPDGEPQYRDQVARQVDRYLTPAGHTFGYFTGRPPDEEEFLRRLDGADGALILFSVPNPVLERAGRLRVLSWHGTGVQRFIDVNLAARLGITVCNARDYGANAVAEHTMALVLAVARNIPVGDRLVRAGRWEQREGIELHGRTIGVVGAGPIGQRVMALAAGFGMRVLAWTRTPSAERAQRLGVEFVALPELFAAADVVTVNLAHTPATEGLVDRSLLESLRPGAIVVNTARAELVDTAALVELAGTGRIAGVGLDVYAEEPPGGDQPLPPDGRSVLSPHVGYYTGAANEELFRIAVANLASFAAGTPCNVVAPDGADA
jgi:phosphoglycerate dehydrogenase-like enzyme